MKTKATVSRKFLFEGLEDRSMLSVTAFLAGTKLEVLGTPANESVQLFQSGANWKVQGLSGTKVNGSSSAQSFSGVTDIVVALGAGKDLVQVVNGTLVGGVVVVYEPGDTGAKTTTLANLNVGSVQVVDFDNGANVISAANIKTTDGGAGFFTGSGNDVISLANLNLAGNLQVNAGNGANVIAVANVQTSGDESDVIETGSGKDSIAVSKYTSATNSLDVMSGDGTDVVTLDRVNLQSNVLFVDVGPGNKDSLTVTNSTAGLGDFLDTDGTNGYITGAGNHFASKFIDPNFTHRSGDLKS